jgi:thiamine-monophosphate kinase
MDEFALIRRYFAADVVRRDDVVTGIGDDGAVLAAPGPDALVVVADTLVAGVHFPETAPPESIGHKALAVNLSDIAAMGAEPAWATLCLTMPAADESWLEPFAAGFRNLAHHHGVALVGGDSTRGPRTVTVQVIGHVPPSAALRRGGARAGDLVCVSGTLGDAALGLASIQGSTRFDESCRQTLERRLHWPEARVSLGIAMRGIASAAIDISDGLMADLGHIVEAGGHLGAVVDVDELPLSHCYRTVLERVGLAPALAGGDDYELCLAVPAARLDDARHAAREAGAVALTVIGRFVDDFRGIRLEPAGRPFDTPDQRGWRHF